MYFVIKEHKHKQHAIDFINKAEFYPVLVDVSKYKKNRSQAQNRLMWKWLTIIGDHLGYDKEDLHDELRLKLGYYRIVESEGKPVTILKESKKFNTKEMQDYMDKIEALAMQFGLVLPKPDDYRFIVGAE